MKRLSTLCFLLVFAAVAYGQKSSIAEITNLVTKHEAEAHLTFLASDEMRGRDTGSPEIDIAANYIASYFRQVGLKELKGAEKFFQMVELQATRPPSSLELKINDRLFKLKEDLVMLGGGEVNWQGDIVFVGYGTREDFQKVNAKAKLVVTFAGTESQNNINSAYTNIAAKNKLAAEAGAVALIEILALPGIPWVNLASFFSGEKITLKNESSLIPHVWMRNVDGNEINSLKETKRASGSIHISGNQVKRLPSKNVIGWIEGTDKKLKSEFVVVSAHYDHVGVGRAIDNDSIYNGARDNAIGTVGLMLTAKYLAKYPPKRSVIFMALTAEEKGMLGSAWYTAHPLVPLKQTVFNFNCDGAGYNDTTRATIIGLERTSVQTDLSKACEAFQLKAAPDPSPEQNLYERSDNFNFAVKGIPAIDFAPGVIGFDEALMKYYHRPADEVSTLNFHYLARFFRAYAYATYLIANGEQTPSWTKGDKFEEASKALYGK